VSAVSAALALGAGSAQADQNIGSVTGPLTQVTIGSDFRCQVQHTGDTSFEFYPPATSPGSCGTSVATGGTLYARNGTALTNPAQTAVGGSGTSASPRNVATSGDLGSSGLHMSQVDSYVDGNEYYRTDVFLTNSTAAPITATVYHAADCYLQNSDSGYGFFDSSGHGIYCSANANNSPPARVLGFVPITAGSNYQEGNFGTVAFTNVKADGSQYPNTCDCTTLEDNGAGLSWPVSVPANGSTAISLISAFSPTGTIVTPLKPIVTTGTATDVTSTSANMNGTVNPNGSSTSAHFEFGTTTSYGSSTPAINAGSDNSDHTEQGAATSLQPNTTYHYRLVATNSGGTTNGADKTFTTAPQPGPPPPEPGKSANIEPVSGTTTVQCPGEGSKPLTSPDQIKLGCTVDATHGTVQLTSANGNGGTQTGDFWAGAFQVTQENTTLTSAATKKKKKVLITTLLVRPNLSCGTTGKLIDARRRRGGHLWGHAKGSFRTKGRHAAATIRGTTWLVEERCDGTLVKVREGTVLVHDATINKNVIIKGPPTHRYLATTHKKKHK
jgi:hypothetical protein